ncbi:MULTISPECIES: NCS1 family nucleobase:cation symporter-1 [unclassified Halomonas]|uniref:NCS1 family nucleobase:cation symporter-1 n=1 Tax=unclassified Halomonas TaxID=2609666 RepID=UPI00209D5CD2|nr:MULTISPECIES: NCS1 family nucleobase:cation symporter-1 [unclassified Halomonas]MCP1315143.1 NCS1 family nucleobase:cation symporter-1 [Halomonas sp. 707D7]MCP1325485.1 NCS1 family nucleobase:cation symporter-1 [Halomonas sp. 707D4]
MHEQPPVSELDIQRIDPSLYNEDLAPLKPQARSWGAFEIFNVWSNDIQSLFGYTLAASLFLSYGLNGWAVMAAIILAGVIVMFLVNLTGKPSVKYGIPFPVMVRASLGVRGANLPAMLRAIVGIFWYGVQTYFASTAVALLITAFVGAGSGASFLGLSPVAWVSFVIVWVFQIAIFWQGIERIKHFLNWAGPLVYVVMVVLMGVVWYQAGDELLPAVGSIFSGSGEASTGSVAAFFAIVGTMVAYFAAVVINFGDFTRFVKTERQMKLGNLLGLPLNVAFFSFIALIITAGTLVLFGEALTNPADIVERVDSLPLTIVAALTFFAATVGINLVANFIPPAYDLANLFPSKISFKTGGLITAIIAFFVGALWVSVISQIGVPGFVNALGAIVAPFYGIIVVDYYLIKRQHLNMEELFCSKPGSAYYYVKGWNRRALLAFAGAALFSLATVLVPALAVLGGYGWLIGAGLGGLIYYALMREFKAAPAMSHQGV